MCREVVREMFHHTYENYMNHAFPAGTILCCSAAHFLLSL
jgi:hypothetical protein